MSACESYCQHGGVCELDAPHPGQKHDSRYCQWTDDEAIPRAKADAIYMAKDPVMAPLVIAVTDIARGLKQ